MKISVKEATHMGFYHNIGGKNSIRILNQYLFYEIYWYEHNLFALQSFYHHW